MKLAQIDIKNFRCFQSLSIPFHPDVNVLVGANGAGKTAVLDAVAISLGNIMPIGRYDPLRPSDIPVASDIDHAEVDREHLIAVYSVATDSSLDGPLSWHAEYTLSGHSKKVSGSHVSVRHPPGFPMEIESFVPVVAYYRSSRNLSGMPEMGDIFKQTLDWHSAYENILDAGANYQAMCQWFYLRENQELRERQYQNHDREFAFPDLKTVRQALCTMLENVESIFFDGAPPTLKVAWAEGGNPPKILSLEQLSDGYRNLLALVLDFARRLALANPDWQNPLEAPGILVIDELELHLHPKWQQRVIPDLRKVFPNTQLIVTTHSPQILSTVRREHILLLGADHQFESIPEDVGTYGAENSRVLAEVFGTHTRPQGLESVQALRDYLALVEAGQHESEQARILKTQLESALGSSDPDLRRADLRVRQLNVLRQP
ncbi:MAG: AAA family ATPase [Magnetococcus sp. YQC-3]